MSEIKNANTVICRSCLADNNSMVTIETLNETIEMKSLLLFFDLEEIEGITAALCDSCVAQLQNILIFKNQCASSKMILERSLYENFENKNNVLPNFISADVKINIFEGAIKTEMPEIEESCEDDATELFSNEIKVEHDELLTKTNTCDLCSKIFRTDNNLTRHKYYSHGIVDNVFPCKSCTRIYNSNDDLENHYLNRHETTCNVCNKKYKNNLILRRHKSVHQTDRPNYFCRICEKFYAKKDSYNIHIKNYHTEVPKKKTICSECGRSVFDIRAHMTNVHKSKELKCTYCDKIFKYKKTLLVHIDLLHEKSSNIEFLCQICGKVFKEKGALKKHTRAVHSDEKNYQCDYCEKKYKANYLKIQHEQITHLNYKPYKCEHCSKSFSRKAILLNHVRVHTGEKPFVCSICSKAFSQKITLRTHRKAVHGINIK